MNPDWTSFIRQRPSQPFDGTLPSSLLVDLSWLGLIRIEGEDAINFMQGQFSNDSRALSPSRSQLSAICTPKGRMLALLRIVSSGDGWLLQLPQALQEGIIKRLRMFVLRSKVVLSDANNSHCCIGLAGSGAPAQIQQLMGAVPEQQDDSLQQHGISCVRLPGELPRFLLLVPQEQAQLLWQQLESGAVVSDAELWRLLAIRAGEPAIYPATAEAFIPQMLNLQQLNGLSFTKGCYTGQEVVARMQYLGKLKRQLHHAVLALPTPPAPGSELYASGSQSGQGAGRIVESAPDGQGRCEVLAVVEDEVCQGEVRLGDAQGAVLQFTE